MRCGSVIISVMGLVASAAAFAETGRHHFEGAVDVSFFKADSSLDSWLRRGSGKLRYDEGNDGLALNRAFVEYTGRVTPTLSGHVTVNAHDDGADKVDILEAFLNWRPVPKGPLRWRARVGAFYPKLSVENVAAGWSSPYALSSSVINTWIGEELRTVGAELRLVVDLPGRQHQLAFDGAVYGFNDPTGAILTWRGWSAHDRQTGLREGVPMPMVSAIAPWNASGNPVAEAEPFREIDNRPGFYGGVQWRWGKRLMVRAHHYDNHADPEAVSGDDYAWKTWFDHVAFQAALPARFGLLGQWLQGSTQMGPDLGPWRVQDVDFDAAYLMLTRQFGKHRLSARYDWFNLQPYNDPAAVTNQDKGVSLAVAWLYTLRPTVRVGAEFLQMRSEHCKNNFCFWVFNGLPRKTNESQVQLSLRWSFGTGKDWW